MNKKIVSIVIISALVITMGAFSVFGATTSNMTDVESIGTSRWFYELPSGVTDSFFRVQTVVFQPSWIVDPEPLITNGNTLYKHTAERIITCNVQFVNNTNQWLPVKSSQTPTAYYTFKIVLRYNGTQTPYSIDSSAITMLDYGNDYNYVTYTSSDTFQLYLYDLRADDGNYYVPPNTTYNYSFTFKYTRIQYYTSTQNDSALLQVDPVVLGQPSVDSTTGNIVVPDLVAENPGTHIENWNIYQLNQNVQAILDQYTQANAAGETLIDQTESNEQTMSTIHDSESNFYQQNSQALQAAGLSNFQFDTNTAQGLTAIRNITNNLFNYFAPWTNTVIVFSMMMSLTTLILRHAPRSHRQKSSSSGGKPNGSGS